MLEAAIAAGTPYIDVCDDADYSKVPRGLGLMIGLVRPCATSFGVSVGGGTNLALEPFGAFVGALSKRS